MFAFRAITMGVVCLSSLAVYAVDPQQITPPITQQDKSDLQGLKEQLFNDLTAGDVKSGAFDQQSEIKIANTQIAIAKYYLSINDRKNAAIYAVDARKALQQAYGTSNDPRLIPVYSLLVQIYESDVDKDYPDTEVSDAAQAQLYRELIDHIHAE